MIVVVKFFQLVLKKVCILGSPSKVYGRYMLSSDENLRFLN